MAVKIGLAIGLAKVSMINAVAAEVNIVVNAVKSIAKSCLMPMGRKSAVQWSGDYGEHHERNHRKQNFG